MTEEVKSTEENQENTQGTEEQTPKEAEKTFTQAELDEIVSKRIARERAKMPNDDELKAYKEWKSSQQTEAEKVAERERLYQEQKKHNTELQMENAALKAGVRAKDVDYVIFRVSRMDENNDFETNLKAFLALDENKKFTDPETIVVKGTKHGPSDMEDSMELSARDREAMGLPPKK